MQNYENIVVILEVLGYGLNNGVNWQDVCIERALKDYTSLDDRAELKNMMREHETL